MSAFLHCITLNRNRWRTRSVRSSINCVHTMHFYAPKTWICQRVIPERNFISSSLACIGSMFCLHPCTRRRRFCVRRSCTNGPGSKKVKGQRLLLCCAVTAPSMPLCWEDPFSGLSSYHPAQYEMTVCWDMDDLRANLCTCSRDMLGCPGYGIWFYTQTYDIVVTYIWFHVWYCMYDCIVANLWNHNNMIS